MGMESKFTGRASSLPAGLAFGAVASVAATAAATFVIGKLLQTETLQWENVGYGVMILLLISSFLGSVVSAEKIKRQRLLICLLSGFIYFGILLSLTALFFGGQFEAVGVTAALVLAGSGTAGIFEIREKRGGKHRKTRKRYR